MGTGFWLAETFRSDEYDSQIILSAMAGIVTGKAVYKTAISTHGFTLHGTGEPRALGSPLVLGKVITTAY
jgi:hypothetical protein